MSGSELTELAARVEAGSEEDRGLDGRIAWALGWRFNGFQWDGDKIGGPDTVEDFEEWPDIAGHWHLPGEDFADISEPFDEDAHPEPPEWCSSLDAVVALIGDQLPEAFWELNPKMAMLWPKGEPKSLSQYLDPSLDAKAASPCRSLLAATLRALAAQQQDQGAGA